MLIDGKLTDGAALAGEIMQKDDLILISVDDHVIEPPDMFVGHLPKKYEAEAPQLVHRDDGTDVWKFRDTVLPNVALNAIAGRPKDEYGLEPQGLDENPARLLLTRSPTRTRCGGTSSTRSRTWRGSKPPSARCASLP